MGADKEATDIWLFGRKRPDLTAEETFAEAQRRNQLLDEHRKEGFDRLVKRVPEFRRRALRAAGAQKKSAAPE